MRRVLERFLDAKSGSQLIFAKDIEIWNGVRGRFHLADIWFLKFLGILENAVELCFEELRFFFGQTQSSEVRDVSNIDVSGFRHGKGDVPEGRGKLAGVRKPRVFDAKTSLAPEGHCLPL